MKTFTTTDGINGREKNPYGNEVPRSACVAAAWHTFERTIQTFPIITPNGKAMEQVEFQGEVVKQVLYTHMYFPERWVNVDDQEFSQAAFYNPKNTRQAILPTISASVSDIAGEEECVVIGFSVPKSRAAKLKQDFINYILNNSKSF